MHRDAVTSVDAPAAIGPYSQAVRIDGLMFLSGQTPVDPTTGVLVLGDVGVQTERCFANLFAVLAATGATAADVQKVNVYLTDMADFALMNAVYAAQFDPPYPARTTVAVAALPLGASVEIELVARVPLDGSPGRADVQR